MEIPKTFDLDFKDIKLRVNRHNIANQVIYQIVFSDRRNPLVVTRASKDSAERFWTSIPEGRQKEAEQFGPLIENYIKSLN